MDSWAPHSLRYPPLQPICQSAAARIGLPVALAVIKVSVCKKGGLCSEAQNEWRAATVTTSGRTVPAASPAAPSSSRVISV